MASALIGPQPEVWFHAETEHFFFHALEARLIHRAAEQAEHSWQQLDPWFGPPPAAPKAHFFLIPDREVWSRLAAEHGWPPSSVALQTGQDLFLLRDRRDLFAQLVIPHELVHLRVLRTCGEGTPFWAEEGLAEFLSWRLAEIFHHERYQHQLHRSLPMLAEEQILGWGEIAGLTNYPPDQPAMLAAVRQVQRMTKSLLEPGDPERVQAFIQTFLRDRKPWPDGALQLPGMTEEELAEREASSRALLLSEEMEGWQPEAPHDAPPPLQPRSISGR